MGFWQFATGGGSGGGSGDVTGPAGAVAGNIASFSGATGKVIADSGVAAASVVVGPSSATDNAIARYDGATGKLQQNSAVTVSDVAAGVVTLATTAGNALAIKNTDPAATTGASVAGDPLTITAGAAVASTDTAGAAAGGSVTITAGAAARNTSGNANGGDVVLVGGAGIGTGTTGKVVAGAENAGQTVLAGELHLNHAGSNYVRLKASGTTAVDFLQNDSGTSKAALQPSDVYMFDGANQVAALYNSNNIWAMSSDFQAGWSASTTNWNPIDTSLSRIAAGQVAVNNATNGMANNLKIATTTVTATGATSTATNLVPAGCILLGVTTRVTTAITSGDGGTTVKIGNGTDDDMYGATIAFALGTTTNLASHTASPLAFVSAAQNVVFTCNGGTFNGGVWRVCAHFLDLTGPTS